MPTSPRHAYGEGMLAIVWEFVVKEECIPAFRRACGPTGDWSALFRQHPGYEGTTLLQDSTLRAVRNDRPLGERDAVQADAAKQPTGIRSSRRSV